MKLENPILKKIKVLLRLGTTKEKICVKCDLIYPTFMNLWSKPTVSKYILRSLLSGGIIDKQDLEDYQQWICDNEEAVERKNYRLKKDKNHEDDTGSNESEFTIPLEDNQDDADAKQ